MAFQCTDEQIKKLFEVASNNKCNAYVPYSHFPVSAALLCRDGSIVPGVNVENCSYPCGSCAERSAIVSAISQGKKDFVAILVTSGMEDDYIYPCGFCRQFIAEWGNLEVISTTAKGGIRRYHISDLLPEAFSPADLSK